MEFDKLKTILSSNLIVRHFDHTQHVYLLTDASRLHGVGYALGHIERDSAGKDVFKIVHCGSKGLTPTQQRYSTIELECLCDCVGYFEMLILPSRIAHFHCLHRSSTSPRRLPEGCLRLGKPASPTTQRESGHVLLRCPLGSREDASYR